MTRGTPRGKVKDGAVRPGGKGRADNWQLLGQDSGINDDRKPNGFNTLRCTFNRNGPMTLPETGVVLAVISVLTLSVVRGASSTADRAAVAQVQGAVLQAYRVAQTSARTLGVPVELVLAPDSIVVHALGADSQSIRRRPGPHAFGVGLTPAGFATTYGPDGLAVGAGNITIVLVRGTVTRQIIVSRLGRVRLN